MAAGATVKAARRRNRSQKQDVRSTGMSVRRTVRAFGRSTEGVSEVAGSVSPRQLPVTHPVLHTSFPTLPTMSPSAMRLAETIAG